jgi:hypothetical protein
MAKQAQPVKQGTQVPSGTVKGSGASVPHTNNGK